MEEDDGMSTDVSFCRICEAVLDSIEMADGVCQECKDDNFWREEPREILEEND